MLLILYSKTCAKQTTKTVQFFLHNCPVHKTSSSDAAIQSSHNMTHAFLHPSPTTPLLAKIGDVQMDTICHLSTIFDQASPSPKPNPAPSLRVLLAALTTHVQPPVTSPVPPLRVPHMTSPVPRLRMTPHALLPYAQPHVTSPVPSLRVTSRAPHPCVQPHMVDPDHDIDDVMDDIVPPCFVIWSH